MIFAITGKRPSAICRLSVCGSVPSSPMTTTFSDLRTIRYFRPFFRGSLPSDEETLLSFKGIGAYTAGAIRSFAFGERAAILDTNVARVLFRVFVAKGDPKSHAMKRHLWRLSEAMVPQRHVFDFNQALMDFGAMICVARQPKCLVCPMAKGCRAFPFNLARQASRIKNMFTYATRYRSQGVERVYSYNYFGSHDTSCGCRTRCVVPSSTPWTRWPSSRTSPPRRHCSPTTPRCGRSPMPATFSASDGRQVAPPRRPARQRLRPVGFRRRLRPLPE